MGSDDDVFLRLLKETKEEMPKLELTVLEGFDHWVVIEKPDEMYDILMEFLGEIREGQIRPLRVCIQTPYHHVIIVKTNLTVQQ